jgi:hypothetical protein
MKKPLRKAPIEYVPRPGEPTLEQKIKAYRIISKEIAMRKKQMDEDESL